MKHKFLSKLILGVLISTTLVGSFTRVSYAQSGQVVEVTQNNESTITGEEINDIIERFKNIQGDEVDGEYTIIKNEGYIGRTNKDTGDITHETYDNNGVLVNSYTTNFYENMQNMTNTRDLQEIQSRQVVAQKTMPVRINSLHYTIADYGRGGHSVYAQNSDKLSKAFDIRGHFMNNYYVARFTDAVDDAAYDAQMLINACGGTVIAAGIAGILGFSGIISLPMLDLALKSLGAANLVDSPFAILYKYNDLVGSTRIADEYFDDII